MIKEKLESLRESINSVAIKCNRNIDDIELIAVTKLVDVDVIKESIKYGISSIGENKVQEALSKYDTLYDYHLDWHFLGHLQTNKIKKAVNIFKLIHSVDSFSLLKSINENAKAVHKVQEILLQINPLQEETKFGLTEDDVKSLIDSFLDANFNNVKILGLMTIAPFTSEINVVRKCFSETRRIFFYIKDTFEHKKIDMKYLSMGMSGDYVTAIEEGANMLRIGSCIFGERMYV
jgi:PLP dependent protein